MFVTQTMFTIIGVFLFGYCFGYYLFEILKYKNQKNDIDKFFSSYKQKYGAKKKYGAKHRGFDRKNAKH